MSYNVIPMGVFPHVDSL